MPLRTTLVCGFLGAGKTTFILQQLKSARRRTAVLVNEFGPLGIDGDLVRRGDGVDVVELPGGCICCSQQAGLVQSLKTIAGEIRPEALLIEPSGIAEASEVLKVLADRDLQGIIRLDAVITVIDASTFLEYADPEAFGSFFLDQVMNADLVVVNKTDLVSLAEIEAVGQRLLALNPAALAVQTAFCRLERPLPVDRTREVHALGPSGPGMECFSMTPGGPLCEQKLAEFSSALADGTFGRIFRAKGFLQTADGGWVNLQMVGRQLSVSPLSAGLSARLTLIGFDLDGQRLQQFFASTRTGP